MTKSERTQKIEEAEAILRELKAAEHDEPERDICNAGDIRTNCGSIWLLDGKLNWIVLNSEGGSFFAFSPSGPENGERLGTFDEVYVLRSEVEKDYVSKKDLKGLQTDSVRYNVRLAEVIHAIDLLIE